MKTSKKIFVFATLTALSLSVFALESTSARPPVNEAQQCKEAMRPFVAQDGSDRTPGMRVAEGGSDRTPGMRIAEGGSDRTPGMQQVG